MIPLLTATGPGAVSRFHIGLVIATGLGIGTLFTLFVVPAFYMLLAPNEIRHPGEVEPPDAPAAEGRSG
jgi:multidrug efflux pump